MQGTVEGGHTDQFGSFAAPAIDYKEQEIRGPYPRADKVKWSDNRRISYVAGRMSTIAIT